MQEQLQPIDDPAELATRIEAGLTTIDREALNRMDEALNRMDEALKSVRASTRRLIELVEALIEKVHEGRL